MPINTPKQRQLQSERIRRVKPWLKSTGAKTPEGKKIVSMNALKKDPYLHKLEKEYRALMRAGREVREVIADQIIIDIK